MFKLIYVTFINLEDKNFKHFIEVFINLNFMLNLRI